MFGRLKDLGTSIHQRSRVLRRNAGAAGVRAGKAIAGVIGWDEVCLLAALGLIATGFWHLWRPGSFLAPGLVLLWLSLPSRARFIDGPIEPKKG